jgi:uncharacterized membrane protein
MPPLSFACCGQLRHSRLPPCAVLIYSWCSRKNSTACRGEHPETSQTQSSKRGTLETPRLGGFWHRPLPLGLVFITAGTLHFLLPEFYLRIIPPFLSHGRMLVYLSGAAEVLGGVGALVPAWRRAAGVGLMLLLVAVFPANAQMLLNAREAGTSIWNEALLWLRLPLQGFSCTGCGWSAGRGTSGLLLR